MPTTSMTNERLVIARRFDLTERTASFAARVRSFVKLLPRTVGNIEDMKQLVRSSGSVAANYLEADEAVSRKEFLLKVKTCRKEAKESYLWLSLVDTAGQEALNIERKALMCEAKEFLLIFSAIIRRTMP